jgi:methionyl-tRNA formyltransferase
MRIGFAGTPAFAATALRSILEAGFPIDLVLARPDRPRGRGMKLQPGPVKALALEQRLPVHQPASLKDERERSVILGSPLDVLVVAAYGLILPSAVLSWPRHGCINIHASLLPHWRGAAPIVRAILAGDPESGISIMRMDEGLDTGPILSQHRLTLDPRETAGGLHEKLATLGGRAVVETLRALERGDELEGAPQDDSVATYAAKVTRDEAEIDWNLDARSIDRRVRAFDPAPGAQTRLGANVLKIWKTVPLAGRFGQPGAVVRADASGIVVAAGDGALAVTELQLAGGKRLVPGAFLAGHRFDADARLGAVPS